ncbi:MAG: hypothetical protein JWP57_2881 [Spirosoma sp.]|nr:hypothetical protein [Spirosoma sp.]
MFNKYVTVSFLLAASLFIGCQDHPPVSSSVPVVTTLVSGLAGPIGVETDGKGRIFVTEQGTGQNDGRVSEVTADGKVYPVITGLYSFKRPDNELDATDHLLIANGILYVLNAKGLYRLNLASFKTGDTPIPASSLTPEYIQQFVLDHNFTQDTGESHLYNMILGPDGSLYFTDAAANAIIRRSPSGQLSVVTEVPGIPNPNPAGPPPGPPFIQSVPTSITFDSRQFAISTLLGFPFPAGKSIIYQMDLTGKLTVYQQGFNSLVDIENDGYGRYFVLEHAVFGPTGFMANTGRLLRAKGTGTDVLISGLNLPTDLRFSDAHTAYITTLGNGPSNGALLKVTF